MYRWLIRGACGLGTPLVAGIWNEGSLVGDGIFKPILVRYLTPGSYMKTVLQDTHLVLESCYQFA